MGRTVSATEGTRLLREQHRLFPACHVPLIPRNLPGFSPLSRQKEGGRRGFAWL